MKLLLSVVGLLMLSACTTHSPGQVEIPQDPGYRTAAVLEVFKKTNSSLSHSSEWAVEAGNIVSKQLWDIGVNVLYPPVVTDEFTARGSINMVSEGMAVASRERRPFVLFLDIQTHKRNKAQNGNRILVARVDSWLVDANRGKLVFRHARQGSTEVHGDAGLAEVNGALRQLVMDVVNDFGVEASGLFDDYLSTGRMPRGTSSGNGTSKSKTSGGDTSGTKPYGGGSSGGRSSDDGMSSSKSSDGYLSGDH